jgi:hypothetical protein
MARLSSPSVRTSQPYPANVQVYAAKRSLPWFAVYGIGGILFSLAILFSVLLWI